MSSWVEGPQPFRVSKESIIPKEVRIAVEINVFNLAFLVSTHPCLIVKNLSRCALVVFILPKWDSF